MTSSRWRRWSPACAEKTAPPSHRSTCKFSYVAIFRSASSSKLGRACLSFGKGEPGYLPTENTGCVGMVGMVRLPGGWSTARAALDAGHRRRDASRETSARRLRRCAGEHALASSNRGSRDRALVRRRANATPTRDRAAAGRRAIRERSAAARRLAAKCLAGGSATKRSNHAGPEPDQPIDVRRRGKERARRLPTSTALVGRTDEQRRRDRERRAEHRAVGSKSLVGYVPQPSTADASRHKVRREASTDA